MKKIRFIINPKSGSTNKDSFSKWITASIDHSKFIVDIVFTNKPGHATHLAKEAADNKFDIVVAVGGDGSVNETAKALMNSSTALGIIPTGSGNGMARHLSIPMNFIKAVKLLNDHKIMPIDTLTVNGKFCIGTFGIGFDAHIAHLFAKAKTRGYSTYVKLILTEFSKYKSVNFKIIADQKEYDISSFLLTFANSSQFGNNAVIAPFANVHDGIMDISIVKKFPFLMSINLIYKMMNNSIHTSKYFDSLVAREILILNDKVIQGHIDGEPIILKGNIDLKMLPLSLNVVVAK